MRILAQRLGMRDSGLKKVPFGNCALEARLWEYGGDIVAGQGHFKGSAIVGPQEFWTLIAVGEAALRQSFNGLETGQNPEVSSVTSQGYILSRLCQSFEWVSCLHTPSLCLSGGLLPRCMSSPFPASALSRCLETLVFAFSSMRNASLSRLRSWHLHVQVWTP